MRRLADEAELAFPGPLELYVGKRSVMQNEFSKQNPGHDFVILSASALPKCFQLDHAACAYD
jgi:hypothetical protein